MALPDVAPSSPPGDQTSDSARSSPAPTSSNKRKTSITEIEVDLELPEPPSKKAKRLLKKGKALPDKAKSGDEGGDDSSGGEDGEGDKKKTKKKERSPYGVWIGNLRFSVTRSDLRTWLVDNSGGSIAPEAITRVHMPMSKEKKDKKPDPGARHRGQEEEKKSENKGFAYVDFATFEANVAAIALSETEWNRRKLLIKDAKSFEGRPKKTAGEPAPLVDGKQPAGAAEKKDTRTKVFVGNLSFQATEEMLQEHFAKCGPIRWIKVATFEDTGKCKGYGWVNFEQHEAAAWAVKGFVKMKETIETVEDFMDADEPGVAEEADVNADRNDESAHRVKTRKWWVNKLQGRALKIELAEDDQVRQKKRFGKGGPGKPRRDRNDADGEAPPVRDAPAPRPRREEKPSYGDANMVARLKGTIVEAQGTKITFE